MSEPRSTSPAVSSLLLATDMSCRCDRAFDRARALAAGWRAKLTVVTAVEQSLDEPSWRSGTSAATKNVRAELGRELDASGIDWDVFVAPGAPHDVVLAAAERVQSQLIVTGVARNELLGRSRPGGTVEALLRAAPAPVLIVKRRGWAPYARVLVPTDFTEAAEMALLSAAVMFPQARFVMLHGYRVPFAAFLSEEEHAEEFREEALERQRIFAQRLEAQLRGQVSQTLVEYGSPDALVADYESAESPDLVVIGAHDPREWLRNEVTGMARKILAAVRCDVLVVPERAGRARHSHSMVAGGLPEMS
jgi:nucleotide-binding universal stress UspA family protein